MEAEKPALAFVAIERRVPFDRLAHAGNGAHDECVKAPPNFVLPARHRRDIGLHGSIALGLRDLRVAACEKFRLRDLAGLLHLLAMAFTPDADAMPLRTA